MTQDPEKCPPDSVLKAWLQGLVADDQEESVGRHLEECTTCDETIQNIDTETETGFKLPAGLADVSSSSDSGEYDDLITHSEQFLV